MAINIGTAGWTIPRDVADRFPAEGTSLERYAARFPVTEINSSFHRPHRLSTWERWRDSVPPDFRFSVKLPKTITHQAKLADCGGLARGVPRAGACARREAGGAAGPAAAEARTRPGDRQRVFPGSEQALCGSNCLRTSQRQWFTDEADDLLAGLEVARVAADPAICEAAALPGGWRGLSYWRLHGSPVIYRSSYADRIPAICRRSWTATRAGASSTTPPPRPRPPTRWR